MNRVHNIAASSREEKEKRRGEGAECGRKAKEDTVRLSSRGGCLGGRAATEIGQEGNGEMGEKSRQLLCSLRRRRRRTASQDRDHHARDH